MAANFMYFTYKNEDVKKNCLPKKLIYVEICRCPWLAQEILHFLQGSVIVSLINDSIPYPWAQKN